VAAGGLAGGVGGGGVLLVVFVEDSLFLLRAVYDGHHVALARPLDRRRPGLLALWGLFVGGEGGEGGGARRGRGGGRGGPFGVAVVGAAGDERLVQVAGAGDDLADALGVAVALQRQAQLADGAGQGEAGGLVGGGGDGDGLGDDRLLLGVAAVLGVDGQDEHV